MWVHYKYYLQVSPRAAAHFHIFYNFYEPLDVWFLSYCIEIIDINENITNKYLKQESFSTVKRTADEHFDDHGIPSTIRILGKTINTLICKSSWIIISFIGVKLLGPSVRMRIIQAESDNVTE